MDNSNDERYLIIVRHGIRGIHQKVCTKIDNIKETNIGKNITDFGRYVDSIFAKKIQEFIPNYIERFVTDNSQRLIDSCNTAREYIKNKNNIDKVSFDYTEEIKNSIQLPREFYNECREKILNIYIPKENVKIYSTDIKNLCDLCVFDIYERELDRNKLEFAFQYIGEWNKKKLNKTNLFKFITTNMKTDTEMWFIHEHQIFNILNSLLPGKTFYDIDTGSNYPLGFIPPSSSIIINLTKKNIIIFSLGTKLNYNITSYSYD